MLKVAVVGAGIIGLTTAITIQERLPEVKVTILADKLTPDTTSDGAGGLWAPSYELGDTPQEDIKQWADISHQKFLDLWKSPVGGEAGIILLPIFRFSEDKRPVPWKETVFGYRPMSKQKLKELGKAEYSHGGEFVSFICEPSKLMRHLQDLFRQNGGVIERYSVPSLESLATNYDVVVNCCGLRAGELTKDRLVFPKRGQLTRVKAPWVYFALLDDSGEADIVAPNQESVAIGGTAQIGDWTTAPYSSDASMIREHCCRMLPGLKHAEVLTNWVGLRPGRSRVRLEADNLLVNGKEFKVIHNYGHGGNGVTLSWGCAREATDMVKKHLESLKHKKSLVSKL